MYEWWRCQVNVVIVNGVLKSLSVHWHQIIMTWRNEFGKHNMYFSVLHMKAVHVSHWISICPVCCTSVCSYLFHTWFFLTMGTKTVSLCWGEQPWCVVCQVFVTFHNQWRSKHLIHIIFMLITHFSDLCDLQGSMFDSGPPVDLHVPLITSRHRHLLDRKQFILDMISVD